MSHVTTIKVKIKSLEALKLACQRLGLEFREGQQTYRWFGHYMGDSQLPEGINVADLGKCTHAISVQGATYEVGVVDMGDHYQLLWDSWVSGGLVRVLGEGAGALVQGYSVEAARLSAQSQGFSVWEESQEDGSIKLHVQVGG